MTYKVNNIDPCLDPRWDKFVTNHPFGWIVHLSGWKKVLESTFPHMRGHYFALIDTETDTIKAGLPVYEVRSWLTGDRLVSIPFATLSDPLVSDKRQGDLLIAKAISMLGQLKFSKMEIRTLKSNSLLNIHTLMSNHDYKFHFLDLSVGQETLWHHFHPKAIQPRIKKAMQHNIMLKLARNEDDLRSFYSLYVTTRKRLGLPAQPYFFFKMIYNTFSNTQNISILLAIWENKVIASHLLYKFNDRVSSEAGGENINYRNLHPYHFLYWESIKSACAEGYKIFDFGRTSTYNVNLINFKRQWGAIETDLHTFYYDYCKNRNYATSNETTLSYKIMRYMCDKAPGPFHSMLSRFCYHHLG